MDIDLNIIVEPNPNVAYHDLAEGGVLLDVDTGEYFSLNGVGRTIWKLISGPTQLSDVVDKLAELVSEPSANVESDVRDFVESLLERGLLQAEG